MDQSKQQRQNAPLSFGWEEHPAIQWLYQNGKLISWILVGIVAFIFLLFKWGNIGSGGSGLDYLNAEKSFEQLQKGDLEALKDLEAILNKHPELHAKYDGLLAQLLLSRGLLEQSQNYANNGFKRTYEANAPFYSTYSENSILIAQGQYQEALTRSELLSQKLQNDSGTDLLQAMNLLRIASLQAILNLPAEKASLENWINKYGNNQTITNQIQQHFNEGTITLIEYIQARIQALQS